MASPWKLDNASRRRIGERNKGGSRVARLREGRGEDQLAGAGGWKLSMKNAWMIRESRRKIIS